MIKSSAAKAKEIQGEARTHEEKIQVVISMFTEDKNVQLDVAKVEESAKETEEKVTQIMKT